VDKTKEKESLKVVELLLSGKSKDRMLKRMLLLLLHSYPILLALAVTAGA
jgi:hypothetical protein